MLAKKLYNVITINTVLVIVVVIIIPALNRGCAI